MHKMLLPVIRLDISSDNVRATQPPGQAKVQILPADVEKLEMFRKRCTAGQAWLASNSVGWLVGCVGWAGAGRSAALH